MNRIVKFGLALIALSAACFAADVAVLHNGYSIRHERREVIGPVTRLYTGTTSDQFVDIPTEQIDHFEADTAPAVIETPKSPVVTLGIDDLVNNASERSQLDPDLIASVIHAESGFNPNARSPKGAQGLMQLMPQTATHLGVTNAFDPGSNIDGGTRYLRELLEQYNFDIVKALAAYNAGPRRVDQYHGVPPYRETQAYVARIVRDFNRKKLAERKAAKIAAKKSSSKSAVTAQVKSPAGASTTPR